VRTVSSAKSKFVLLEIKEDDVWGKAAYHLDPQPEGGKATMLR